MCYIIKDADDMSEEIRDGSSERLTQAYIVSNLENL
jgi:hypothetical protein